MKFYYGTKQKPTEETTMLEKIKAIFPAIKSIDTINGEIIGISLFEEPTKKQKEDIEKIIKKKLYKW